MAKVEMKKELSEIHVTVSSDKITWQASQEKAFQKIKSNLTLKGFRKGQAPDAVARKSISDAEIFTEALKEELSVLAKKAAEEITADMLILDSPTYKVDKINAEELDVTFVYSVYPEVKLPDYKKLGIKYEEKTTTKKDVEAELDKIVQSRIQLVEKKGNVLAKGDQAIFNFEGFIDGKPFPGGKAENYELEIGSGQFIAGFEDQMVGLKIGEERDIKVRFPDEYHVEGLKGKDSLFKIKLNAIKVKDKPVVNDEWVKSLNVPNTSTVEELKKYIETVQNNELKIKARNEFMRKVFDKISAETKVKMPTQIVAKEMDIQRHQFEDRLKQQGLAIKQYFDMTGQKPEQLQSQFKKNAEQRLMDSFIFAEVAKAEKIMLKDEDYESEYGKYAKLYGQTVEGIKGMITKEQMQVPMTNDKVIDLLIEFNK